MVAPNQREVIKIKEATNRTIDTLAAGAKRTDHSVAVDFKPEPIEVTGYWIRDVMRIDIKL